MADVDPFAARLEELKAQAPAGDDPFAARLAELQAAPAAQAAPAGPAAPPPEEGFFKKGLHSIEHGVGSVGSVLKTLTHQAGQRMAGAFGLPHEEPPTADQGAAQVRELTRGVDDVVMLGHGQKLAARIGNALGDTEKDSLDETRHFSPHPLSGDVGGPSQRQARDAQLAPDFRSAGQTGAMLLPNPLGRAVGGIGGALMSRAGQALPAVANFVERAPSIVTGPATSLAGYEATAPAAAALSAGAEGHRGEVAKQAITDPGGVLSSLLLGGFAPIRNRILNSEGGQKRQYIEQHGEGARVGWRTPGKGGVYANQLHGLPENAAGIGEASLKGSTGVMDDIEQRHEAQQGYPYRGGRELVQDAETAARDATQQSQLDVTLAQEQRRAAMKAAKNEMLVDTAKRAKKLVGGFEAKRRTTASEPYEALSEEVRATPEGTAKQDATDLAKLMRAAVRDVRTPHDVRVKLAGDLALLEQFSDAPPPAEPPPPSPNLPALLKARETAQGATAARLDQMIAAEMAPPEPAGPKRAVRYMVPADQLNGFRANLMDQARVGTTDAPRAHEAPLRAAAFAAKALVDQGPYAELNRQFTTAVSKVEKGRQGVGLKRKSGNDRTVEVENLAKRLRKGINDPTQIPGKNVPEAAQLGPLRQRIDAAEALAQPAIQGARATTADARAKVAAAKAQKAAGDEAAIPDRRMLGLNSKIGTRETDVNQLALRLSRDNANSETAGRSQADLDAFRAAHPDQATNTRLADLMRNRLDLKLSLDNGGSHRVLGHLTPNGVLRAVRGNLTPLAGRVAYGPAKKLDPVAIARALGVVRGATLGEKVKKAIEADKELRQ